MPRDAGENGGARKKRRRPLALRTRSAKDKPPEGVRDVPRDERKRERARRRRKPPR